MNRVNDRKRMLRRASAVVETAVVAPLLVLAMFGMVELGSAYNVKQTVTLASREGARAAALLLVVARMRSAHGRADVHGQRLAAGDRPVQSPQQAVTRCRHAT